MLIIYLELYIVKCHNKMCESSYIHQIEKMKIIKQDYNQEIRVSFKLFIHSKF
jgi:hypothetical protein